MSYNWKNILVSPTLSIENVLKIIDSEALKIVLVVDEHQHLLGTVTDGDIRRALIEKKSLSTLISDVMFKEPTTAEIGVSREYLLELMRKKQLLSIPLLDNKKDLFNENITPLPKYENVLDMLPQFKKDINETFISNDEHPNNANMNKYILYGIAFICILGIILLIVFYLRK